MIADNKLQEYKNFLIKEGITEEDYFEVSQLMPNGEWEVYGFDSLTDEEKVIRLAECMDFGDLGLCGCYLPNETREMLVKLLEACDYLDDNENDYKLKIEQKREWLKSPFAQFVFYVLNDKGYLEHGSSISGSWTTEKGKIYLDLVKAYLEIEADEDSEVR